MNKINHLFETRSLLIVEVEHLHSLGFNKKTLSNHCLNFVSCVLVHHIEPPPELLFSCSTLGESTQMPHLKNPTFPYVTPLKLVQWD